MTFAPDGAPAERRVVIVLTYLARVNNWSVLRSLNAEVLVGCARQLCAQRFRMYRNSWDASQLLVVAELPDHHAAQVLTLAMDEQLRALAGASVADKREWEVMDFDGIG